MLRALRPWGISISVLMCAGGALAEAPARVLPLTYLADALRQVMVGATPFVPLAACFAILAGWLVVCLALSARFFRWQ